MDFFSDIIAQLAQEKVASPRLEAREIFAFVLQKDIAEIYSGCEVNYEQKQQIVFCTDYENNCLHRCIYRTFFV